MRREKKVAKQKSLPKQWDILTKMLIQANPQDLVSWILPNAVYQGELNVELQKKYPVFADLLYTIKCKRKKVVLHIEFQRRRHTKMNRRVWEYNCLASIHTGLPVYSVVIYLVKEKSIVESPYEMKFPTGLTLHRFQFQNIKLWEIPLEVLKEQKLPGLLPLLPLTKDGDRREVVEEVIEGLQQAGRTDLLPLAYVFSAYTFDGENVQQWLIERFNTMKDLLEDNWAYREMVKWAEEKALKQGKKEMEQLLVRFVEIHFPDLVVLAKQQAALAKSSPQLQEILNKLFVAHTDNEARDAILGKK